MAKKQAGAAKKRTYVLNMTDGTKQKITVPADWKLTFGPLVPGSKGESGHNGREALVLRIYEGNKDNQRAVFVGVQSWRDTQDLSIEVEKVDHQQQAVKVSVEGQGEKIVQANMEVRQWIDPDQPQPANPVFGNLNSSMPLLKGIDGAKTAREQDARPEQASFNPEAFTQARR